MPHPALRILLFFLVCALLGGCAATTTTTVGVTTNEAPRIHEIGR